MRTNTPLGGAFAIARMQGLADARADVWHASEVSCAAQPVLATGYGPLDAQLPGGGWPVGALVEVLQPDRVHSEWRLLLPALVACGTGPVVLVGPPQLPFAPALSVLGLRVPRLLSVLAPGSEGTAPRSHPDPVGRLWATEQVLRCADVDAVVAWLPQVRTDQLRRLHLAAAEHHKLLFVMRPERVRAEASPAVLRLLVQPEPRSHGFGADTLEVHILKRRGPPVLQPLRLHARSQRLDLVLAASRMQGLAPDAPARSARGQVPGAPWTQRGSLDAAQRPQALGHSRTGDAPHALDRTAAVA